MKIKSFVNKNIFLLNILLILSGTAKPQPIIEHIVSSNVDKTVVCFVYHRFGDGRYPTTNVSNLDFESHLKWLSQNNYHIRTFSEAIDYLRSDQPLQKTAVITIDDGYKSFYKNGLPLLEKYKIHATLFINTETVGSGDYMDWPMLKAAMTNGIEIGNHTHSHKYFLNEPVDRRYKIFEDEITLSQSIIQKNLNITPIVFSYPYGEFDVEMKNIVKHAGFKAAAAQNSGVVYSGTDMFMCPRFPMSEKYSSLDQFKAKALAMPLKVINFSPENSQLPKNKKPNLTLVISSANLRLDQLQCFVQGGTSIISISEKSTEKATTTFQSFNPIVGRRRTLYTITIPDKNGVWHWYSHLWIDTSIKD